MPNITGITNPSVTRQKDEITPLSRAAEANLARPYTLVNGLAKWADDPFDKRTNRKGVINLGLSENKLMADEVAEKLNSIVQFTPELLGYGRLFEGTRNLRTEIANLLNDYHGIKASPLTYEQMCLCNGASAALNNITAVLCNPGEAVMCPAPFYGGFDHDLSASAGAQIVPIPCTSRQNRNFLPDRRLLEKTYRHATRKRGLTVRMLLICNPHNPLGQTIPRRVLRDMLEFARDKGLHVVVDEIYGLSVWRDATADGLEPFTSVLAMKDLPDPNSTHVVWSFSKDFCISGIRSGALISRNPRVLQAASKLSSFTMASNIVESTLFNLLRDRVWVDWFISKNRQCIRASYTRLTRALSIRGIPHLPANAGFFVWMDLRHWLRPSALLCPNSTSDEMATPTWELEVALADRLVEAGVNLARGEAFFVADEPGWFRIIFSIEWEVLELALERFFSVLDDIERVVDMEDKNAMVIVKDVSLRSNRRASSQIISLSVTPTLATKHSLANKVNQNLAIDFSHLFSDEGLRRVPSSLDSYIPIMTRPGMVALGWGLPKSEVFPFIGSLSVDVSNPAGNSSCTTLSAPLNTPPDADLLTTFVHPLQYGAAAGQPRLRALLQEHIQIYHQPRYKDWDVVASVGNTNALESCLRLLCNAGDAVLVSQWTYSAALETMRAQGLVPVGVKTDEDGFILSDLIRIVNKFRAWTDGRQRISVVYCVPTGGNPTGEVMSLERRQELLTAACDLDLVIIEDDPYHVIQYLPTEAENTDKVPGCQEPSRSVSPVEMEDVDAVLGMEGLVPSIFSLDPVGRVVYLSTFSKSFAPGIRCGFIAGHPQFLEKVVYYNELTTMQPSGFSQAIIIELLSTTWRRAGFEGHVRYLQRWYTGQRNTIVRAAQYYLQPTVPGALPLAEFTVPRAGMFVWFRINLPRDHEPGIMRRIFEKMIDNSVLFVPGHHFGAAEMGESVDIDAPYFRVAFSYVERKDLETAMEKFAYVLREFGCGQ